jgi:hypothetical protein
MLGELDADGSLELEPAAEADTDGVPEPERVLERERVPVTVVEPDGVESGDEVVVVVATGDSEIAAVDVVVDVTRQTLAVLDGDCTDESEGFVLGEMDGVGTGVRLELTEAELVADIPIDEDDVGDGRMLRVAFGLTDEETEVVCDTDCTADEVVVTVEKVDGDDVTEGDDE